MLAIIRAQGIKLQVVFWCTLILLISFAVLFGVNFGYYKSSQDNAQLEKLKAVSELASQSILFPEADKFVAGEAANIIDVETLVDFVRDVRDKTSVGNIVVLYQDENEIKYLFRDSSTNEVSKDIYMAPPDVLDLATQAFYSGQPVTKMLMEGDSSVFYYIHPVMQNLKHKFVVCSSLSAAATELNIMRYIIINISAFLVVLIVLDILIIYATDKILIHPILEIEKMVDSFVYQVSGGHMTFYYKAQRGNELTVLKKSVLRLEKLVSAHNKMMEESGRYSDWLRSNLDRLGVQNSQLSFMLKSSQYDALMDKETLTGNLLAWERSSVKFNLKIKNDEVDFLQLVYLDFDIDVDYKSVLETLMEVTGIYKSIPMEVVFRISSTEFVFVFTEDGKLPLILDKLKNVHVKTAQTVYNKENKQTMQEMLEICKNKVKE